LTKLLGNKAVVSYLRRNQPDFLDEFKAIIATASLDEEALVT
jgi:hypothetical protein